MVWHRATPGTPRACKGPCGSLLVLSLGQAGWLTWSQARLALVSVASIAGSLCRMGSCSCWYRTMAGGDVRGRVTDGSDSPIAVGWSDRARAMALKTVSDWLRLRLQIRVALATANGQARERASDERRRKAERGGVGTPHLRGVSGTVLGVSVNELGSIPWHSRAWRLVSSVIRRLGCPSALRPSGRRPESGVALERAIAPPSQDGVGGLWVGSPVRFRGV